MESLRQEQIIEFWKEVILETKSVLDPIFLDYLQSIDSFQIWSFASDDNLKAFINIVNRMLNENSSRSLGLTLLNQFIQQVDTNRFIVIQDSLNSSIHIIVKYVDQELVQKTLVNILIKCHNVLELNQTLSNSLVPKILTHLSATATHISFSASEIKLLQTCLELFHGPCGNHRANLEKKLLPYVDSNCRSNERVEVFKIIPLLSSSGGGGTKRDKHGQDWYGMNIKILRAMQSTILQLYCDACPSLEEYNPYETEFGSLELPEIHENNVFLRYSLLQKRLESLADLLGHYLSEPFPAPKPVPSKSILNIVCKMILLNPVDLLKSKGSKELVYVASILPVIHESALNLLNNLISCVGPNLLPESSRIEQLSLQEFKWISKTPQTFIKLKVSLYKLLLKWFGITNGFVTTNKTLSAWVEQVRLDIQVERTTVELKLTNPKSRSNKKNLNRVSSQTKSLSNILTSNEKTTVEKNSDLGAVALQFLEKIIPTLDKDTYRITYVLLAKTIMEFSQHAVKPSPYDQEICRINICKCVLSLAVNPHPKSPISLGVLVNLIRQHLSDTSPSVVEICHEVLSSLERIVHPIGPAFSFPDVFVNSEADTSNLCNESNSKAGNLSEGDAELEVIVQTRESSCQTNNIDYPSPTISKPDHSIYSSFPDSLTEIIETSVRTSVEKLLGEIPKNYLASAQLKSRHSNDQSYASNSNSNINVPENNHEINGFSKRKAVEDNIRQSDRAAIDDDKNNETPKKFRREDPEEIELDNDDCVEWLNDFVDLSPEPRKSVIE